MKKKSPLNVDNLCVKIEQYRYEVFSCNALCSRFIFGMTLKLVILKEKKIYEWYVKLWVFRKSMNLFLSWHLILFLLYFTVCLYNFSYVHGWLLIILFLLHNCIDLQFIEHLNTVVIDVRTCWSVCPVFLMRFCFVLFHQFSLFCVSTIF